VPLLVLMYSTESFLAASISLLVVYSIGETYISLNISIVLNITPKSMHALRKF